MTFDNLFPTFDLETLF